VRQRGVANRFSRFMPSRARNGQAKADRDPLSRRERSGGLRGMPPFFALVGTPAEGTTVHYRLPALEADARNDAMKLNGIAKSNRTARPR
jgi:hypothetical protein